MKKYIKNDRCEDMLRVSFRHMAKGDYVNAYSILMEIRQFNLGRLPHETVGRVHKQLAECRRELNI